MTNSERISASLTVQPLKLQSNRVWRTYSGGKALEAWLGQSEAADDDFPEEWVASVVKAKNVGREHLVEGYSRIVLPGSSTGPLLKDLIEAYPEAMLGIRHAAAFGQQTAVLVKVLDAAERLTIQVHPDRAFAKEAFDSAFGKTEAWYVLGGRPIDGEEPYVLFGFKPGVTRERWKELFDKQDIPGMIDALHRIPVQEGDVFLVEGGVPHAIGSGCFLIEIQEPTDLTLRTERTTPRGHAVPDQACHQGLGFERMLDCFHYANYSYEEALARYRKTPVTVSDTVGGTEWELIGAKDTDRFRMNRVTVTGSYALKPSGTFAVAIVTSGSGSVRWEQGNMAVRQGDRLFIPAGVRGLHWSCEAEDRLDIVLCYPPASS
jgi:mannose-6-phosphate isomerase